MNIWLILWAVLAVTLISFSVWTFTILMRQKRAWRVYAEKRDLRYKSNALMESPTVSGAIGKHGVDCFTSEHQAQDARMSRKMTAIEVKLNSEMPVAGAIASGGMVEMIKIMNLKQEYMPKHQDWDKEYVASADNRGVLAAYMTDERVAALCRLMKIKNSWVILVFKDQAMLLRIDLANPLASAKQLDAMVKDLLAAAEVLELKKGESKRLESEGLKVVSEGLELEMDEDSFNASGLSLEDDEGAEVSVEMESEDEISELADDHVDEKEKAEDETPSAPSKSSKKK